jgi:hypothetical protein
MGDSVLLLDSHLCKGSAISFDRYEDGIVTEPAGSSWVVVYRAGNRSNEASRLAAWFAECHGGTELSISL